MKWGPEFILFFRSNRNSLFILLCSYMLLTVSMLGFYYASYYAYYRVQPFSFGMAEKRYLLTDPDITGAITDEQIEQLLTIDAITMLAFYEDTETIGIYDPDYFYNALNLQYALGVSRYFNRTDFELRRNVAIQLNYSSESQSAVHRGPGYEIVSESNLNYFAIPDTYRFVVNLSAMQEKPSHILLRYDDADNGTAVHRFLVSNGYQLDRLGPVTVMRDLAYGLVTHVYGSSTGLLALLLYPLFSLALLRFIGTWKHKMLLHQTLGGSASRVFFYHLRDFAKLYLLTAPLMLISVFSLVLIYRLNQDIISFGHVSWLVLFHVLFVLFSYSIALIRAIRLAWRR